MVSSCRCLWWLQRSCVVYRHPSVNCTWARLSLLCHINKHLGAVTTVTPMWNVVTAYSLDRYPTSLLDTATKQKSHATAWNSDVIGYTAEPLKILAFLSERCSARLVSPALSRAVEFGSQCLIKLELSKLDTFSLPSDTFVMYDHVRASRLTTRLCARIRRKTTSTAHASLTLLISAWLLTILKTHGLHVCPKLLSLLRLRP